MQCTFYQNNKIGSHFTTSPEISQTFGECIAMFLFRVSNDFRVNKFLELGPGNGTLMSDIIRTMSKISKKIVEGAIFMYHLRIPHIKPRCKLMKWLVVKVNIKLIT